jgi:hypothetical protein
VDVEQHAELAAHFLTLERICTQFAGAKMAIERPRGETVLPP